MKKSMERYRSGAEEVLRGLEREDVEIIFGYPGGAVLPVYDELGSTNIRHILCRHEQAGVHMADGYARATGRTGVCMATSGPGATNMVTGLATAFMDSSPLVAITGQVPRSMIGNDAFQEVDTTGITIPVTKHNYLISDKNKLSQTVSESFYLASTGRRGPVLMDIPKDILAGPGSCKTETKKPVLEGYNPTVKGHAGQIRKAAGMIAEAERPLIVAGGGICGAEAEKQLGELADEAKIPVASTLMGKNAFPNSSPLYLGLIGYHGTVAGNTAVQNADLIIAAGTRFGDRSTGPMENFAAGATIIHIDIDPAEISKNIESSLPIVGDAAYILDRITGHLRKGKSGLQAQAERTKWLDELLELKRTRRPAVNGDSLSIPLILERMNSLAPDAIYTTDVGRHQIFAAHHLITDRRRSFITSGGLGTMGFGLPAAIGAKAGCPDRQVFAVCGDGSFLMCCQELVTAVEEDLPVICLVMNDRRLGMISQLQDAFYGGRYNACSLGDSVDYAAVAEGFGALGIRVEKTGEIDAAVKKAADSGRPAVIEFILESRENTYPMVTGDSLTDYAESREEL